MVKQETILVGEQRVDLRLPAHTHCLTMPQTTPLQDPQQAIAASLLHPINAPPLAELVRRRTAANPEARAVIVISDNTRPVPYKGAAGILWPIVEQLLASGVTADRIIILVATGTHRGLTDGELRDMLDERVFEHGVAVINHDCRDQEDLVHLGRTQRGSEIFINRHYVEADIKILTGLVESHFMAGVSGGRKSVCPGLLGEQGTYVFHGAAMLADAAARDLVLEGNPCHDEALEVAKRAGVDFIVNVTLDAQFRTAGVFAGDLEQAHAAAARMVQEHTAIPVDGTYDLVITHGGFVGINHYQTAKAAVVALPLLHSHSRLILGANTTDQDPVGSAQYRTVLHLLKLFGAEAFTELIHAPQWSFVPEQWQVQMWARLFAVLPMDHFTYYSPQTAPADYAILPGRNGRQSVNERIMTAQPRLQQVMQAAVDHELARLPKPLESARIALLRDGPYGVPQRCS